MIKLGDAILNGAPRIVASVTDMESNQAIVSKHIDILEVRVDQFENIKLDHIKGNILQRSKTEIPIILTVRNDEAEGGGHEHISDDFKYEIFKTVISMVHAVDIELNSPIMSKVVDLAREQKKLVIISSHNVNETESNEKLEEILQKAKSHKADVVKMAMQANSLDDVRRFMTFTLKHKDDNVVTMSLGSVGSVSRLTFPSVGSLLTYSYIGKQSAPGQISIFRLQDDLRFYYPEYNQHFINKFEIIECA